MHRRGRHGVHRPRVPILHGIEIYKGRPIFYSLGNFIFHSHQSSWLPRAWRSAIADMRIERGVLKGLTVTPILLNAEGTPGESFYQTRGAPRLAKGDEAAAILNRLAERSAALGTTLKVAGAIAELRLK